MSQDDVRVIKVAPYPIECRFETKNATFVESIVKLTDVGFLAALSTVIVKVHQIFIIEFEIPVLKDVIFAQAQIVKTYDKYTGEMPGQTKGTAVRIAECHFKSLSPSAKRKINKFLVAIKQDTN